MTLLRKTNKNIRVRWFTTMVGVKATLKMAKKCLREMKETTKIRETAFVQGKPEDGVSPGRLREPNVRRVRQH